MACSTVNAALQIRYKLRQASVHLLGRAECSLHGEEVAGACDDAIIQSLNASADTIAKDIHVQWTQSHLLAALSAACRGCWSP
jgi:hypothetical protein